MGCFFSGAIALFVLPLHLALAGAPPAAAVLVIGWMLSQWPIALYLSRSGNFERALTLSAGSFALFTASICALTGGVGSFAVMWLAIPCLEAAFAARRKTALVVTGLCGALYLALLMLPNSFPADMIVPASVTVAASLGALIYTGGLVLRIVADRKRLRALHTASAEEFQTLNRAMSGIVCKVQTSGEIQLLAGPARQLFGTAFAAAGPDWIFARLHVTDRPLYLTRLSEARFSGMVSKQEVLIRTCAEDGEDVNSIQFSRMMVKFTPLDGSGAGAGKDAEGRPVLVALDPVHEPMQDLQAHTADIERIPSDTKPLPIRDDWQHEPLMKSA